MLGPSAHPSFADLLQPLGAMARAIDLRAVGSNPPTPIDSLHPCHHPDEIFANGQITAHQLLLRPQAMVSVIHRTQLVMLQQFRQFLRIHAIILIAFFQQSISPRKVTCTSPRSPSIKSRIVFALVSMILSITILPAAFLTAIEMLSLCTSMPIYLLLVIKGAPLYILRMASDTSR